MSLYLPDTGYVQGMAALAATLLCYYEEDRAFVMLVRLWMLRGLERLYESGFAGLMDALEDFEKNWLRNGDVAKKLVNCPLVAEKAPLSLPTTRFDRFGDWWPVLRIAERCISQQCNGASC